jgi:GNAT superfamily N-acetyltransferase
MAFRLEEQVTERTLEILEEHMAYMTLTPLMLDTDHICCAISDKKCSLGYGLKKAWLTDQYEKGYRFTRLDERAKVFIEYGPAEEAWIPVSAPDYYMLGCFWVSGKYKGQGHAKSLLKIAREEAMAQGKKGLTAVVGKKKFHFMSDTRFLMKQGFVFCDENPDGFALMVLDFNAPAAGDPRPQFFPKVKAAGAQGEADLIVYYSDRCPFADYYVQTVLPQTAKNFGRSLDVRKITSKEDAQAAPTPATIFSLYYQGRFITTDMGVCLENRFPKVMQKAGISLL